MGISFVIGEPEHMWAAHWVRPETKCGRSRPHTLHTTESTSIAVWTLYGCSIALPHFSLFSRMQNTFIDHSCQFRNTIFAKNFLNEMHARGYVCSFVFFFFSWIWRAIYLPSLAYWRLACRKAHHVTYHKNPKQQQKITIRHNSTSLSLSALSLTVNRMRHTRRMWWRVLF